MPTDELCVGEVPVLVSCWSVKGGSGTTVVSAALALVWSRLTPGGSLLVDLAGEAHLALGVSTPGGPGVAEWLAAPDSVGPAALDNLTVQAADHLTLLPRGEHPVPSDGRWAALTSALTRRPGAVVIDAGSVPVPTDVLDSCDENLLVLRPCYLALERAKRWPFRPSGLVVIDEPGHALGPRDVSEVLGVPVRAVVPWDTAVSRAVDAGMLRSPLPLKLLSQLRSAA